MLKFLFFILEKSIARICKYFFKYLKTKSDTKLFSYHNVKKNWGFLFDVMFDFLILEKVQQNEIDIKFLPSWLVNAKHHIPLS